MSPPFLSRGRRASVIAVIVTVELASGGLAIGVAASGLTTAVTVSVDGAAGAWAPALSASANPPATVVTDAATTPPIRTSDQSVAPAPVTTTSTAPVTTTSTAPVATSTSTAPAEQVK